MLERIGEIAGRIRDLREVLDISVSEMAEFTHITEEEYLNFENGETDFSFNFIYKCAKRFGVDIADIIVGTSPKLTSYSVVRNGDGVDLARREGFRYRNLAPLFKGKMAEPFYVTAPYQEKEDNEEIKVSSHKGQEIDFILEGSLKVRIDSHIEILNPGDVIYYDSTTPHGMVATGGKDCKFYAVVLNPTGDALSEDVVFHEDIPTHTHTHTNGVSSKFITTKEDKDGRLLEIDFKNEENFNFAFDVLDEIAKKSPDKTAMLHLDSKKNEHRFTFSEISRLSSKAANYFASLGIEKGDRVMLVLKRNWEFWVAINALHKIGAIVVPATNLLVEHDFEYRFNAAGIKAICATIDGNVAEEVEKAQKNSPTLEIKIIAGGKREGWRDFDKEIEKHSDIFEKPTGDKLAKGSDPMLMFFTSGTTGYPKIAMHNFKYPLGHFITAKYWHNVNPDGLHFTIADTGWGKALWGKLYGQWLCEAGVFTYDFDRFNADDILPLFKKYNITTFCAPPTMYRFFIREDLSKYDLSSLEYATVAGEALNPEVYNIFYKATGVSLMEGFGQTETTVAIANLVGTKPKPGSMGKPSPLYDICILNPDGTSVKPGETGEICIRTDKKVPCGLFMGYYNDEEKTRECWHDGIYHTGDTAWQDEDGYLWYIGRCDDVIKSSGYRIGPFEIESVLMELPYVLECAITAAPDEIRGQVVKATIVLTKDKKPSDELKKEIQNYVKTHTAPYKYPRIIDFVDALPKTISGKIRRVELRE